MNPINKKPSQQSDNYFYGVNINDKAAVEKEYKRLKERHRNFTILTVVVLLILGGILLDFVRVNTLGGKPIFAVSKKVENGTLFSGIGYKVLYCDDGNKYIGSVIYKSCGEVDVKNFSQIVYEKIMEYGEKNKIIDKKILESFTINDLLADEDNDQGGKDYLVDATVVCTDARNKCFKTDKEFNSFTNMKFYVRLNKFNEVYDILTFKSSGEYYNLLKENYSEQVKQYLIDNELLDEENLRQFELSLVSNNGKYKFRGTTYADTYLIKIDYMCVDNGDTCINAFDKKDYEGDYSNLTYYASIFLDAEDNLLLVGPREYLDIE